MTGQISMDIPSSQLYVGPGSIYRFGKPYPLNPSIEKKLCAAISGASEIIDAYFPICRIDGVIDTPTHILFVVLKPKTDAPQVIQQLIRRIDVFWPETDGLDIIPVNSGSTMIQALQEADCALAIPSATKRMYRRLVSWWSA